MLHGAAWLAWGLMTGPSLELGRFALPGVPPQGRESRQDPNLKIETSWQPCRHDELKLM